VDADNLDCLSYSLYLGDHLYVVQKVEAEYDDRGRVIAHNVILEVAYVTPEDYTVIASKQVTLFYPEQE
jgi:hypothetical protein